MEEVFQLGIKGLIKNSLGEILLLKTDKFQSPGPEHWDLPGGRIQKNETIEEALSREIFEETGIKNITNIKQLYFTIANFRINSGEYALILGIYECEVEDYSNIKLSEEHVEYKWVIVEEAKELLTYKYQKDFLDRLA